MNADEASLRPALDPVISISVQAALRKFDAAAPIDIDKNEICLDDC